MIPFSYQPGNSFLHNLNALSRLILFICLMVFLKTTGWINLGITGGLLLASHLHSRISLRLPWRSLVFFLFMTALVFWGEWRQTGWIPGLQKSLSFLLTLYGGLLFASLTDPMDLGEMLYRLARPIPFFPAGKLMLLVSLSLSLLPLIGEEAEQLKRAQASRCADRRFNPFLRIYSLTVPLMGGLIRRSDEIATALYSREVQEHPTLLSPGLHFQDCLIIAFSVLYLSLPLLKQALQVLSQS